MTYNQLFDLDLEGQARGHAGGGGAHQENGGISADGKTVTVKLKPDSSGSDGTPLTAADVAWTLRVLRRQRRRAAQHGARHEGHRAHVAVDATTVRIEFAAPKSDLFTATCPSSPSTSGRTYRRPRPGQTYREQAAARRQRSLHDPGVEAGLLPEAERNPEYWGTKPAVDEIIFIVYQNAETHGVRHADRRDRRCAGHPAGAVPGVRTLPGITGDRLQLPQLGLPQLQLLRRPGLDGHPVLLDAAFRNALNWAVDREKLADVAYNGFADRGDHAHAARQLDRPRLPLAAPGRRSCTRSTSRRRTNCSTRPVTRRRSTACVSTRASRSPCASGRWPTTSRSRRPAS